MFWKTIKNLRAAVLALTRESADWCEKYQEERAHSRELAESLDDVEQNYRILKEARAWPTRRLLANVPPQDAAKLQENLAVEEDNPLLQAVLCTIRANLHIAMTRAAEPKQEDMKPGYYDGGIAFGLDLEDDLLRIREEGMAKKAGSASARPTA